MAFDPTKPATGSPLVSAEMRNQLNALKAMMDNLQTQLDALPTSPDMTNAISDNSAANVNAVVPLNLTVSDPPTAAETQAIVDKLNEVLTALWR